VGGESQRDECNEVGTAVGGYHTGLVWETAKYRPLNLSSPTLAPLSCRALLSAKISGSLMLQTMPRILSSIISSDCFVLQFILRPGDHLGFRRQR